VSLGKKLAQLRRERNWKQKDLAEKLGVNQKQLVRWENDQTRPRARALDSLAQAFDVPVQELTAESPLDDLGELNDPELRELLNFIPKLSVHKREALKVMLKDMVACYHFSRVASEMSQAS